MVRSLIFLLIIFRFIETHSQSIVGDYGFHHPLMMEGYHLQLKNNGEYEYSYVQNGLTLQEKGIWEKNFDTLKLKKYSATIEYDCSGYSDSTCSVTKSNYLNCIRTTKEFQIITTYKSIKRNGGIEKWKYHIHQWHRYVFNQTFSKQKARIDCKFRRFVQKKDRIYLKALFECNCANILM
jgi:hypothetical protein